MDAGHLVTPLLFESSDEEDGDDGRGCDSVRGRTGRANGAPRSSGLGVRAVRFVDDGDGDDEEENGLAKTGASQASAALCGESPGRVVREEDRMEEEENRLMEQFTRFHLAE